MEILYSIFIGMISSKIVGMIVGIVLQCRRDKYVTRGATLQLASERASGTPRFSSFVEPQAPPAPLLRRASGTPRAST